LNRLVGFAGVVSKRVASAMALLVGASSIIYLTVRMAPGNAVDAITPMGTPEDIKQQLAVDFGLNEGPIIGYFSWLSRAIQGDLGDSLVVAMGSRVVDEALPAYWITLRLSAVALLACLFIAFLAALATSHHQRRSGLIAAPIYFVTTIPSFIMAVFLIHGINSFVRYNVSPDVIFTLDWYALGQPSDSIVPTLIGGLALVLSDGLFVDYLNALRAELIKLKTSQFIMSVRSRGASIWPHIIRNLWVPLVAGYAARLPLVLSSVVIVEKIFGIEGAGFLLIEAAKVRDLPMVVGVSLLFTMTIIAVDLLASIVRIVTDPREVARGA